MHFLAYPNTSLYNGAKLSEHFFTIDKARLIKVSQFYSNLNS